MGWRKIVVMNVVAKLLCTCTTCIAVSDASCNGDTCRECFLRSKL